MPPKICSSAVEAARRRDRGPTLSEQREAFERHECEAAALLAEKTAKRSVIAKAAAAKRREKLQRKAVAMRKRESVARTSASASKYMTQQGNVTSWSILREPSPAQNVPAGHAVIDAAGMAAFLEEGVRSKCCGTKSKCLGIRANETKGYDEYVLECRCCKRTVGIYAGRRA